MSTPSTIPTRSTSIDIDPRRAGPEHAARPARDLRVSALEQFLGDGAGEWMPAGVSPFALVRVPQDAMLVHEGAVARCMYLVQAGSFKTVRTGEDGYEQVLDFVGRHDVLGCDGLANGHHASGAVALEESWVYALPLADIRRLARQRPEFNERWQATMAAQIAHAGELSWLTAAVGAEKRVARFLLLLSRRMAERGESPRRLRLRMCRRDVAGHLGLAHESVSRSLSMLTDLGMLRVDNREIEIVDGEALRVFASCTRGYPDARRAGAPLAAEASRHRGLGTADRPAAMRPAAARAARAPGAPRTASSRLALVPREAVACD